MSPLAQFALAGLGTYLIRLSAVALASRLGPPSEATTATLRLIAPAVLAAIVADQLVLRDGSPGLHAVWLIAGAAAGLVMWRWRSAGSTMAFGLALAWVVEAVL